MIVRLVSVMASMRRSTLRLTARPAPMPSSASSTTLHNPSWPMVPANRCRSSMSRPTISTSPPGTGSGTPTAWRAAPLALLAGAHVVEDGALRAHPRTPAARDRGCRQPCGRRHRPAGRGWSPAGRSAGRRRRRGAPRPPAWNCSRRPVTSASSVSTTLLVSRSLARQAMKPTISAAATHEGAHVGERQAERGRAEQPNQRRHGSCTRLRAPYAAAAWRSPCRSCS